MGFKESLKVNPEDLKKSGKRVAIMRLQHILEEQMAYVQENDGFSMYEKAEQISVFMNISKILSSYDELEPVLKKYFAEKAEKERFER